jgi:hypothetical protein
MCNKGDAMEKFLTPLRAVRAKCLDCSVGQPVEVRMCEVTSCALFPFRMGKNPNRKGIGGKKHVLSQKSSTQVKN